MTKALLTGIMLYLILLLEVAVAEHFVWAGMRPSFLAVTLVGWVLREEGNRRLLLAAALGLLGDCFSGGPLGVGMMLCIVSIWLVEMLNSKSRNKPNLLFQALLVMGLYLLGLNGIHMLLAGKTELWVVTLRSSLGTMVYSSLLVLGLTLVRFLLQKFWSHSSLGYAR